MEEARRQEQSTGQNRLAKVYRDLAEQQADIIDGSISVMDVEGDRRTRFTMRQLASRQEEVRVTLSEVVVSNEEVSGNRTFMHVHDRIDDLSGSIITDLRDGRAAPMTIFREQTILNHLVDLADSLEQDDSDERFAESGSGSGSGSGDGQETESVTGGIRSGSTDRRAEIAESSRPACSTGPDGSNPLRICSEKTGPASSGTSHPNSRHLRNSVSE